MRGATVLGVGSMIGAGIFALLGEAGAIAGSAVWISFLIGGVVAGLLGYVCSKLGMRYPSSGGLITYLVEGFGRGRLVGVTSWLGYISAVVVVTAMVAVSFGGYAVSLFVGDGGWSGWDNVLITALLVVMCALIGVFGTLTVTEVIGYGETAIAEAARPTLGDAGFTIMAVAALLSTAGCTNATLYASDNLTGMLAQERFFPPFFGPGSRLGRHSGLLITTALVLVIANLGTLGAIASVGSAVSMMVFVLVAAAGWRRRRETGSNPAIVLAAIAVILVVLGFFVADTVENAPETFGAIVGVGLLAIVLDAVFRRTSPEPQPTVKEV